MAGTEVMAPCSMVVYYSTFGETQKSIGGDLGRLEFTISPATVRLVLRVLESYKPEEVRWMYCNTWLPWLHWCGWLCHVTVCYGQCKFVLLRISSFKSPEIGSLVFMMVLWYVYIKNTLDNSGKLQCWVATHNVWHSLCWLLSATAAISRFPVYLGVCCHTELKSHCRM